MAKEVESDRRKNGKFVTVLGIAVPGALLIGLAGWFARIIVATLGLTQQVDAHEATLHRIEPVVRSVELRQERTEVQFTEIIRRLDTIDRRLEKK